MNNRQRMYATNKKVRTWLLENHYDEIWFKPHLKKKDIIYTQRGTYLATDLWNLFDGMCFGKGGDILFLQMKTNAWASSKGIRTFIYKHKGCIVLSFNVTNKQKACKGKYKVLVRYYSY